jgi:hypothetical protein
MSQVRQYPRSSDGSPLDLTAFVMTDSLGNSGQRTPTVRGPDGAPVDQVGAVFLDQNGVQVDLRNKLEQIAIPYDAAGDGATDDFSSLQAALDTGRPVWLDPTKTYAFGSRLIVPSGSGFIGGGKLLMLTGAGKFDGADYAGSYDRIIGIFVEDEDNVRIEARIELQANAEIRTASAIWVRNCTNVHVDVECWGFKETRFGIIEWDSNIAGTVKADIHDCYVNTLGTMQVTGLAVDSNRYDPGSGAINSVNLDFDVRIRDVYFGATALAAYGYQTDGVSLMGEGWTGHTGRIRTDNVHEPLDIWSDGNNINIVATDCLYGAKVAYGARHNILNLSVDLFANSGIYIGGSTALRGQTTAYNDITLTAKRGGEIGVFANVAAVTIDGSGDLSAEYNRVNVRSIGDGAALDYGARLVACNDNTVIIDGTGFVAVATDGGTNNLVRREQPTMVRAHLSANTTYADLATILCDTETTDRYGEYNPATGVWTCKSPGAYQFRIKASMSVNAGQGFGSYIFRNVFGGGAVEESRKRETNTGAGGATLAHDHSTIIRCAPGDQVYFRNDGVVTTNWFAGISGTYIEITEL